MRLCTEIFPHCVDLLKPSYAQIVMDNFDEDSCDSGDSHQDVEAEGESSRQEELKEAGLGDRPVPRKRKRTSHERYQRSIRNLKNRVSWI